MSTKLCIATLKQQHLRRDRCVRQQTATIASTYRFYTVLTTHAPVPSNVLQLLRLRSGSFLDYGAFCRSLQPILCQQASEREECAFLTWFDELTSDCRRSSTTPHVVLWCVLQTLLRRIHCGNINTLNGLHHIESDNDYYRAAYTFLRLLDYLPLTQTQIND